MPPNLSSKSVIPISLFFNQLFIRNIHQNATIATLKFPWELNTLANMQLHIYQQYLFLKNNSDNT